MHIGQRGHSGLNVVKLAELVLEQEQEFAMIHHRVCQKQAMRMEPVVSLTRLALILVLCLGAETNANLIKTFFSFLPSGLSFLPQHKLCF